MSNTTELKHHFDLLINSIDGAENFRQQKAIEYPDDDRNADCSAALSDLREYLLDLGSEHVEWTAVGFDLITFYGLDPNHGISVNEWLSSTLSRWGFNHAADPAKFLDDLHEEIKNETAQIAETVSDATTLH